MQKHEMQSSVIAARFSWLRRGGQHLHCAFCITRYLYGSIRCSFGASCSDTSRVPRICRFDFVVLLVRMWRLNALALTIFPVPVFLKRLAAPRCVLSFGISLSSLSAAGCWPCARVMSQKAGRKSAPKKAVQDGGADAAPVEE